MEGDAMRGLVRLVIATGIVFAASPASAQRYDPAYPFCAELADENGSRMECFYVAMEQCKEATKGMPGTCLKNPFYKPSAAAEPEPTPTPSPTPVKKKKK
jgi:hypothetical protein